MNKEHNHKHVYILFSFVLLLIFLLRLLLSNYLTYESDMRTFQAWADRVYDVGFSGFYDNYWCDYMPGYIYILWVIKKITILLPDVPGEVIFKLPSNIADIIISALIFIYTKRFLGIKTAFAGAMIYCLNPAVLGNSTFWGQVDSFHALPVVLSAMLISGRYYFLSGLFATLGFMIKPHSIVIYPLLGIVLLKPVFEMCHGRYLNMDISSLLPSLSFILSSLIVLFILPLPFVADDINGLAQFFYKPFSFVFERFFGGYGQYEYTSVNAFNLWGIFGMWQSDQSTLLGVTYRVWSILIFGVFYSAVFASAVWSVLIDKRKTKQITYSFTIKIFVLVFFALFLFVTRVHERHLLTMIVLFSFITWFSGKYLVIYAAVSLIYVANLLYSYQYIDRSWQLIPSGIYTPVIYLSSFLLMYIFFILFTDYLKERCVRITRIIRMGNRYSSKLKGLFSRNGKIILLAVIAGLGIGLKFHKLDKPANYYFDEIYFAYTANQVSKGDVKAWEQGHSAPGDFAYEWTHPPLGKELIASGIKLFGNNAFGWRFFQALFGSLGTILIYLLVKELFKSFPAAIFASFLYTFDCLIFVLSRISMVDIFLVNFIMASSLFFIKYFNSKKYRNLLLAGIFCGASVSVKWNGAAVSVLLLTIASGVFLYNYLFRVNGKERDVGILRYVLLLFVSFILIPLAFYLLTYLPYFLYGHSFMDFIDLQASMFNYHKGVTENHSYQSSWWSWPLMMRSVFLYLGNFGRQSAYIYAMGNPVIWWTGCIMIIPAIFMTVRKRSYSMGFVLASFLMYWIPWSLSPRKVIFIYHYLPSLIFVFIMIGYLLDRLWNRSVNYKLIVLFFLFLAAISFFYFYPILTAQKIPSPDINDYMWLKGWR